MWFFDIFKNIFKKENHVDKFFEERKNDLLSWWEKQVSYMAIKISDSVGTFITVEEAANYYVKLKFMLSMWTNPNSIDRHTASYYRDYTKRCFHRKLSDEQADKIFLTVILWDQQAMMLACWIWLFNTDTMEIIADSNENELPNGKGKFWYVAENPIPVKWIISNQIYLDRLYTEDGKKIKYQRIWSTHCGNIQWTIDMYEISDKDGQKIAILYIMPYFSHTSTKAPDWFILHS